MEIERHLLPRSTIEAFAEKHGLVMEVHERSPEPGPKRFYAHFRYTDVFEDTYLIGAYGNGASEEEAILAYAHKISGRALMVNAHESSQREIIVPVLNLERSTP